jgi:eukaryotic-like serine/threonine-protein kinase
VKPANIFVCRYGIDSDFVKLLDFGIVKDPVADVAGSVTAARVIAGTPSYMSPEMALGSAEVDWRSDIYALGCVAYSLVTGRRVFEGPSSTQIISDHIRKPPTPPGRRTETPLPPELERIIMSCLEKDPQNRPQSALELGRALESIPFSAAWGEERARKWWLENGPREVVRRPQFARATFGSAS